jgi:SAM-dependent methyltransferase
LGRRVQGVVLPGDGLPFADGAFDLTCCTEVLEHVADFEGTVAELQRVTRPGGLLLISTPNYRNVMGVVKAVMDHRRGRQDWDPWHAHAGGFERPVTIGALRRAFDGCDEIAVRGADYAFALGITNVRVRRRLSRYLLLAPGRYPALAGFGMQCFLLLRRSA